MTTPKSPNSLQRFIHRFLMLRPVSAFLSTILHRLDLVMLKITKGKHTVAELVGLPMIQITTIGLIDGEKIALIGSNFGQKNNPGWYYNLKANPQCTVQFNGQSGKYIAREIHNEEREKYWQMAVSIYRGYELYKVRAAHRLIPVMILEPEK